MPLAGFKSLNLPIGSYSSDQSPILEGVVRPILTRCESYDRSVGYLLPSHFSDVDIELLDLVERRGRVRFLIGDPLHPELLKAAQTAAITSHEDSSGLGLKLRELLRAANPERGQADLSLVVFQYLVSTSLVDVRLNLRESGRHHEKTRIARAADGEIVMTVGSDNDSTNALSGRNSESGTLIANWIYPETDYWQTHGVPHINRFERLWKNEDLDSVTLPLEVQIREQIASDWYERNLSSADLRVLLERYRRTQSGGQKKLRDYQEEAIEKWAEREGRGVLAFCTGAGKTFTAIEAAKAVAEGRKEADRPLFIVVCVPFKILASQWVNELEEHFGEVHACWSDYPGWEKALEPAIWAAKSKNRFAVVVIVVVNKTLVTHDFQRLLGHLSPIDTMVIGDEVHRHGTEKLSKFVPQAEYMLGLSATPWSQHEAHREKLITDLYGEVIAEFGIEEALDKKVLCPYYYELIEAPLTPLESQRYEEIAGKINYFEQTNNNIARSKPTESLETLIRRRSSILGTCRSKIDWIRAVARAKRQPYDGRIGALVLRKGGCGHGLHGHRIARSCPARLSGAYLSFRLF